MHHHPLGNTGLTVSVAGLGCGGNSRLGLGRGASFDECVAVARAAIDLGVNFLDTAEVYGTEEIVGTAVKAYDRDKLVISTKALFKTEDTAETVTQRVEASLKRLGLDHVDIFHFHAVGPAAYEHHRDVLAPALLRLKEQGKVRHVGLTETGPRDPEQAMLARAALEAPWEVIMLAYSLVNQGARTKVFPVTVRRGIGTLLMFVVRNIFSNDAYRRAVFAKLVEDGRLDKSLLSDGADPLAFLVAEGGAESITDAAYRYARHEKGADVILFGTGNRAHVKANIESILRPPLPVPVIERLHRTFGHLTGVGLDLPGPVKA